jgi:4-aminobutyrate aminotransferase-like enzyme
VRGEGAHLFDADGTRFLDAYNNVACVGHCNPRVIDAVTRQMSTLAGSHPQLLTTGGHGQEIAAETVGFMTCDPHLTLRGIRLAYDARSR